MNKYDISSITVSNREVRYKIPVMGKRITGIDKVFQIWLKKFLGDDCGDAIRLLDKLRDETVARWGAVDACRAANNWLIEKQRYQSLKPDETFRDCTIKNLDIDTELSKMNIELVFTTESETLTVII
jgi:hypothetical protein